VKTIEKSVFNNNLILKKKKKDNSFTI